ncbi:MAG: hypothetical protein J5672_02110 [Verrucomicrobia bacterium]|nr:hypothetical protein [Verrucomicrobiota bacterium]
MNKEKILDKILEKADFLYWQGLPIEMTDLEFDSISAQTGHISKPPETLKGWAQYPDYCLLKPHYGLKKVSLDFAKKACYYSPKWDGIYIQVFIDDKGIHAVTRGDGRIGKDLAGFIYVPFGRDPYSDSDFVEYELCYPVCYGGRVALVKDLSAGNFKELNRKAYFVQHGESGVDCGNDEDETEKELKEIPSEMDGGYDFDFPCDGWVIELANGEKYAYKGSAYE